MTGLIDSRLALSQWETLLQSNAISYWLGTNLESDPWWGAKPEPESIMTWHLWHGMVSQNMVWSILFFVSSCSEFTSKMESRAGGGPPPASANKKPLNRSLSNSDVAGYEKNDGSISDSAVASVVASDGRKRRPSIGYKVAALVGLSRRSSSTSQLSATGKGTPLRSMCHLTLYYQLIFTQARRQNQTLNLIKNKSKESAVGTYLISDITLGNALKLCLFFCSNLLNLKCHCA